MKRVLITGATGGLGSEIARALSDQQKYHLILTGRDIEPLQKLQEFLYCKSEYVVCDLSEGIGQIATHAKDIDILINCAGIFPIEPIITPPTIDFDSIFAVNVKAPLLLARLFAPGMKKKRWGRIINIGSSSAYSGSKDCGLYCASKHALLGLTRSLHEELKPHNVQCTFVAPGSMKTPMAKGDSRVNYDECLEPSDVARKIVELIESPDNMIIPELRIDRMSL